MKKYLPIAVLIGTCLIFFYKTLLFGKVPFPGDLLVSGYAPWDHESYAGYVTGAVPSKNQYFDVIRELYPWKTVVVNQLKQGKVPLWNPYNFSGAPLLANYQSQVFYPLTFLYYVLPQATAWIVMVIIQPILGSLFLYLFATEIGMSEGAAILTALLFNFSSFANVWMEFTTVWHTILWVPFLLYLVERGVKQKSLTFIQQLLFIFGLFCAITGGHPQDFINSFLLLTIYTLIRVFTMETWSRKEKLSFLIHPIAYIFGIPFFIAAPQLFPTIELFRHSARVAHDYMGIITTMLVQWWQLPLLAVSDFFGNPATKSNITGDYVGKTLSIGVVGLTLAVTALGSTSKSWHKKFFLGVAIFILLITVRTPITEFLYRYPWPVLSTGTPTRVLFILVLSLAILAGFGFDALKQNDKFTKPLISLWIVFGLLWVFTWVRPPIEGLHYTVNASQTMKHAMILGTMVLGALTIILVLARKQKLLLLALIPLAIGELMYSVIKFNPFVPTTFVYPPNKLIQTLQSLTGINRFWAYGTGEIEANFATQVGLYSPDGTDPLNLSWYNRLLQSSANGQITVTFNRTTRSDAQLAPGYGKEDLPGNQFRLRLMDLLGVKYVLDRSENPKDDNTFPTDRFKLLSHLDDWIIYENLDAAPRFFITTDVRPYTDEKNFQIQFFDPEFNPSKTVLLYIVDFGTLPRLAKGSDTDTIRLIQYGPTRVEFTTDTSTKEFLFLSDTFDNGWTATVNGKPVTVYKADYAFRGVVVPGGTSTVVFTYLPKSFQTGLVVSAGALLLTVVYIVISFRPKKRKA